MAIWLQKKVKLRRKKFNIREFRVRAASKNILLLSKLTKEQFLTSDSHGRLKILTEHSERKKCVIKNLCLFGSIEKRTLQVIEWTFLAFCHEARNPLDLSALRLVRSKTLKNAESALEKISHLEEPVIKRIKSIIAQYQCASLFQERLLARVACSVRKASKKSRAWVDEDLDHELEKNPLVPRSGCSGSYIIKGKKRALSGIFKPFDEEIGGPNNPTKTTYRGVFGKRIAPYGICSGEGIHREVAASIVDKTLKLGIVPETFYMEFSHTCFYESTQGKYLQSKKKKQGSFQEYIIGYKQAHTLRKSEIAKIPGDQFHRFILLDIVIGNLDRNVGNVLTNGKKIRAIDHALSFSNKHIPGRMRYWTAWPQMQLPFFPWLQECINQFPVELLCARLKKRCFIDPVCLQRMRERIALLQAASRRGLSVKKIVQLMSENNLLQLEDRNYTLNDIAEGIVERFLEDQEHKSEKCRQDLCYL